MSKKKLCIRTIDSYLIDEDKIKELSLTKHKNKDTSKICNYCNTSFTHTCSLNRHVKLYCKVKKEEIEEDIEEEIEEDFQNEKPSNPDNIVAYASQVNPNEIISINNSEINNSNINSNNTINNNNINININLLKSFDEDWDVSKIDINKKLILLLNNSKFTQTLENILENEVNLNVIIDSTSDNGLVYKDNKLINMNIKDIVKKSMEKLHKHLCDFHQDIVKPNDLSIDVNVLDYGLETANKKYNIFKNDNNTQNEVNNYIRSVYNKKNARSIKQCRKINEGF
jgi:hypothetical protein